MVRLDLGSVLEAIPLAARADTAQSDLWTPDRPVTGHCALASVFIKRNFGGQIASGHVSDGVLTPFIWHYWNVLPSGAWLDSTRSQFDNDLLYIDVNADTDSDVYWFKDTEHKYALFQGRLFDEYRRLQKRIVAL